MVRELLALSAPYLRELVVCCGCYLLFSVLGLVLSRWTSVEEWIAKHPRLALAFALFRRAGFDVQGIVKDLRKWAANRAHIQQAVEGVQKVGMVLLLVASSSTLLTGCALFRRPSTWDVILDTCVAALSLKPEVREAARARGLAGGEWAAVVCNISDVIEPFVVEKDTKIAAPLACASAREKGLVK